MNIGKMTVSVEYNIDNFNKVIDSLANLRRMIPMSQRKDATIIINDIIQQLKVALVIENKGNIPDMIPLFDHLHKEPIDFVEGQKTPCLKKEGK